MRAIKKLLVSLPYGFGLRLALVLAAASVAAILFTIVPTADHPERPSSILEGVFRALGLFVATSSGLPSTAESGTAAFSALWAMHIIAPDLSGGLFADAVVRLVRKLRSPSTQARRSKGHVIVCGLGKHGRFVTKELNRLPLVAIDRSTSTPDFLHEAGRDRDIPVLHEDLEADLDGSLAKARIDRARLVIAATGNDVLNLSICLSAVGKMPLPGTRPRALALVADDVLSNSLREALERQRIAIRNPYELAAEQTLEDNILAESLDPRDEPDSGVRRISIVIIGFGKFGQALLRACSRRRETPDRLVAATGRIEKVVLVDKNMDEKSWMVTRASYPVRESCQIVTRPKGDAENPEIVEGALEAAKGGDRIHVVLCTDNEAGNLRLRSKIASMLDRSAESLRVVLIARTFERQQDQLVEALTKSETERQQGFFHLYAKLAKALGSELRAWSADDDST